jgi:RHS repeat-associated protein
LISSKNKVIKYPFGLEMKGICDKAVNKLATLEKYNGGVELDEVSNMYETYYRGYDQQIGRFRGVDIQAEGSAFISTYQFGFNNPISSNDPLGNHPRTMGWSDYQEQSAQLQAFNWAESKKGAGSDSGGYDWSNLNQMEQWGNINEQIENIQSQNTNGQVYRGADGSWTSSTMSDKQALSYMSQYMTENNYWGRHEGWATSAAQATANYISSQNTLSIFSPSPSQTNVYWKTKPLLTMTPQIGNLCALSALSYVNNGLGGKMDLSAVLKYIAIHLGQYPNADGIDVGTTIKVANMLFNTVTDFNVVDNYQKTFEEYKAQIDAGHQIITSIPETSAYAHAVVIIGYTPGINTLIYMNPVTGIPQPGIASLFINFGIPIISIKH